MRLKISPQWHVIAVLTAMVVVGFRVGTILSQGAWSSGRETTLGKIDDIEESRRVRVIRYSYRVNGMGFTGEETSRTRFLVGIPARVTYSKGDPSISTLFPEDIESHYRTSLLIVGLGILPVILLWCVELGAILRRAR